MKRVIIAILILIVIAVGTFIWYKVMTKDQIYFDFQERVINAEDKNIVITDEEFQESERKDIEWVELDQLETYGKIRKSFDEAFKIISFDRGNKNGCIYVDKDGNWTGNTTLKTAYKNKVFKDDIKNSEIILKIVKAVKNEFTDIGSDSEAIDIAINIYFDLLPMRVDKTSGIYDILSREEAYLLYAKSSNPVTFIDDSSELTAIVGDSKYNNINSRVINRAYINKESLTADNYRQPITVIEFNYLVNNYDTSETNVDENGFSTDLERALEEKQENVYKLKWFLESGNVEGNLLRFKTDDWNQPLTLKRAIDILRESYSTDITDEVNTQLGVYEGEVTPEVTPEPVASSESGEAVELAEVSSEKVKGIVDIDKLIEIYGDELDMSDEEIAEAKKIGKKYKIEEMDEYHDVAHCTWLNVRVGPSADFDIKKSVPVGTKVHIVGIRPDNGWYRVIADGKIAYQCGTYFK